MIPSPNLDDRTFQELVEEAKRLIPQYCPEWTNFNPSDPGITLIELYAWMTELMLYRLNKVPEKNYLAFLELMGVRLESPQAAEAVLCFMPSETAGTVEIPERTGLLTRAEGGARPIPFETVETLRVVNTRLEKVISQVRRSFEGKTLIEDVTDNALSGDQPAFRAFQGTRVVERYLYLGDDRLQNFLEGAVLSISIERACEEPRSLRDLLEWEFYDGNSWRGLTESNMAAGENLQIFSGPPRMEEVEIDGVVSHWIRARLVEVPANAQETVLSTVRGKLEVIGEGVVPERLLANVVGDIYLSRDPDKNFLPFDREPRIDSTFYLRCDSILSQQESVVRIEVDISDSSFAEPAAPSAELLLRWEFFNGKKWMPLGKTGATGVPDKKTGRYGMLDSTHAFSQSGLIEFQRPSTSSTTVVNGEEGHWVRVRVEAGDYGLPGSYENVDDRWVWQDERPLRPPSLKRLVFKSTEEASAFKNTRTYNDWCFKDVSSQAAMESQGFQAFESVPEESPTLFMGFSEKFPETDTHFYIRLTEDLDVGMNHDEGEQTVVWEFWDGKNWGSLLPRDETNGLTRSGFIRFRGPKSFKKSKRFGENFFWLRARLEMGGYDLMPQIDRILMNAVIAKNITTYQDTILGASQGTPNQVFSFSRGPVLPGQRIVVREKDEPTREEKKQIVEEEGADALIADSNEPGYWLVRWHEVESLYESGPRSRHYVKDIVTGEIQFGDGIHGMIPPKVSRNIVASLYPVGGGEAGNVKAGAIRVLKQSYSFIDGVTNPFSATGGCDMESVEQLKLRGPHLLKSRNRAVTAEDFEWLAIEASNSVARVKAMPNLDRIGEVAVIVVPRISGLGDSEMELREKPVPSAELLRRVGRYLDERRLLTTVIHVVRPRYVDISLELKIVRATSGPSDRVKRQIDQNLRRFLHPLVGGRDGKGWPFGRSVYKVDLYHLVEEVEGVDFVESVTMQNVARGEETEQLRLADDQLVHLVDVQITELAREHGA